MSGDKDGLLYWPKFFSQPLQQFFRILVWVAQPRVTKGPNPTVYSWFSLRHPVSNRFKPSGHLVVLSSNVHLLPLFSHLFTQVHLLIDRSVEGQYITLMRLSWALKKKQPLYEQRHDKVILQHDNGRPRIAKQVKNYFETLNWGVLPKRPYSPDVAPFNYSCSDRLAHGLAEQHFISDEDAPKWVYLLLSSKYLSFFPTWN